MASQNTDFSSWDILYNTAEKRLSEKLLVLKALKTWKFNNSR
jgi:hypothetical protein